MSYSDPAKKLANGLGLVIVTIVVIAAIPLAWYLVAYITALAVKHSGVLGG